MVEEQGRGDVPESELLPESSRISKEHILDRCEGKDGANVPRYIRFMRGSAAFGVTETVRWNAGAGPLGYYPHTCFYHTLFLYA